jgi:hypothetical protein
MVRTTGVFSGKSRGRALDAVETDAQRSGQYWQMWDAWASSVCVHATGTPSRSTEQ